MLNPSQLRTFLGVVDAGSFSRAARHLGMTQPGVSQHVARLEEDLGTLLVHRRPRGIELTPAGQRLLAFARAQEAAEKDLRQGVRSDEPYAGECRISSPGPFGLFAYPRLLALQERHRELVISYAFAPNRTVRREVREGVIDLGFVTGPVDDGTLTAERFGEETLQIVVPRGYRVDTFADLEQLGFFGHPDGYDYASRALRAHFGKDFRGLDMVRRSGFGNQVCLLLDPVARGFGFTVLPDHAVATSAYRDGVDVLPTPTPVRDPIWAVWRGDVELPARFQTVLEALRAPA